MLNIWISHILIYDFRFQMYFLALIGYWEFLLFFLTELKSVGMSENEYGLV